MLSQTDSKFIVFDIELKNIAADLEAKIDAKNHEINQMADIMASIVTIYLLNITAHMAFVYICRQEGINIKLK